MNIKRVKQSARMTYVNGIYMILTGLFLIFFYKLNMKINFSAINQLWGFFSRYNDKIAELFGLFNVSIGLILIPNGILIMYLSDYIIKRKDKFTWVILFISEIITWGSLLVVSILIKNIYLIAISFIGWLWFIIGILLPIRYYLEKNYKEY
jgi:hypothetical protein